jgi:hypothetical protein
MPENIESEVSLSDLPLWGDIDASIRLEAICKRLNVPVDVLTELVALQRQRLHQERAHGIYPRIEEILGRMD